MFYPNIIAVSALIAALALGISACQPSSQVVMPDDNKTFCQTKDTPFAHRICTLNANKLANASEGNNDYEIKLFWQADDKTPLLTFERLLNHVPDANTLSFAMNAGMYNDKFSPIGYTVIDGVEVKSLNLKQGGGNFHLLPNGVFWQDQSGVTHIDDSHAMNDKLQSGITPTFATQSGPMLVIDGQIHPKFNQNSTSLKIRNGVGVCADGRTQFVISDAPVNFYDFAALFKDDLNCPNALFLDGGIASALYAPSIDKYDKKEMGVMIGVTQQVRQ